jgi:tRNA(Ile)-lysidine synthase
MASTNFTLSTEAATVAAGVNDLALHPSQDRLLVAFSGGADSTALLILLLKLGYEVVVGHVDHGMRLESAADARHCRRIADSLGLPFHVAGVKVDPPSQAVARRVRYEALQRMATESGATAIATGHTLDDQAETVELRLRRGGLGLGIPARRSNIVRPLLGLRRSQTEKVCREAGLPYLDDPSNHNSRYARVRIRNELAAAGEDRIYERAASAERVATAVRLVQQDVDGLWQEFVHLKRDPKTASISRAVVACLERGLARQLLRRIIRVFDLESSTRLIDDVLDKVVPVTGARLALTPDLWAWSETTDLFVGGWSMPPVRQPFDLLTPGVIRSPEWGLECHVREVSAGEPIGTSRWEELIDAAAVDGPLSIRAWMPGDRFRPLGSGGSKKLQDFFVDAGVARRHRQSVPILWAGTRIAWVVGHRIDDGFKLTKSSSDALHLRVSFMAEEV